MKRSFQQAGTDEDKVPRRRKQALAHQEEVQSFARTARLPNSRMPALPPDMSSSAQPPPSQQPGGPSRLSDDDSQMFFQQQQQQQQQQQPHGARGSQPFLLLPPGGAGGSGGNGSQNGNGGGLSDGDMYNPNFFFNGPGINGPPEIPLDLLMQDLPSTSAGLGEIDEDEKQLYEVSQPNLDESIFQIIPVEVFQKDTEEYSKFRDNVMSQLSAAQKSRLPELRRRYRARHNAAQQRKRQKSEKDQLANKVEELERTLEEKEKDLDDLKKKIHTVMEKKNDDIQQLKKENECLRRYLANFRQKRFW